MTIREEITRSLRGAFLLARFDVRGLEYFNFTLEGFWRSFAGAALIAPLAAVSLIAATGDASVNWLSEVTRYCVGWALFPLVMIPIARLLGLSNAYVPFVIAYNWTQVVQALMFFILGLLHRTGLPFLVSPGPLDFAALVYAIVYFVFVARMTLGVGSLTATGLAILDMVTSYLVLVALPQYL